MDGPIKPDEIFAACFFFAMGWGMAYVSWTRKPDVGMDSKFYRYVYKWSDDQINQSHRFGAVFAALLGTMTPLMVLIRSYTGRQILFALFLLALLSTPFVLYWLRPPKPVSEGVRSSKSPKIIAVITLGLAIVIPILAYMNTGSAAFALVAIVMGLSVPAFYLFISRY